MDIFLVIISIRSQTDKLIKHREYRIIHIWIVTESHGGGCYTVWQKCEINIYSAKVSHMILKDPEYLINFLSVKQLRHTQWLSSLTAVQMQTANLSQKHWEWPSGCYSMAASPPSCHPAHSLSSMPLIVLGRGGPFLLTSPVLLFLQGPALRTWSCREILDVNCDTASTAFNHIEPKRTSLHPKYAPIKQRAVTTGGHTKGGKHTGGGVSASPRTGRAWAACEYHIVFIVVEKPISIQLTRVNGIFFFQYSSS